MKLSKIKATTLTDADLRQIAEVQKRKLKELQGKGYTKEQLYLKFPKVFVDRHF